MHEVQVTVYEAWDGTQFPNAVECREYEAKAMHRRLVGLTEEQVINAVNGDDADLADVIERLGARLRRGRQSRGDLRRRPMREMGPRPQEATADDQAA